MENLETLDRSIQEYKDIQAKQCTSLNHDLLPDIETMNFERSGAFTNLKVNLDHFLNLSHSEPDIDLISRYQAELETILETDRILREQFCLLKDKIKQHMQDIDKGKTIVHKYAKATGRTNIKTICLTG